MPVSVMRPGGATHEVISANTPVPAFLAAGDGKPVSAPIIDATPQMRTPRAAAS